MEGGWVFGGCELSTDKWGKNDFFAVCVENRTADTLLPTLTYFVRPGTTVVSDLWKAYDSIEKIRVALTC